MPSPTALLRAIALMRCRTRGCASRLVFQSFSRRGKRLKAESLSGDPDVRFSATTRPRGFSRGRNTQDDSGLHAGELGGKLTEPLLGSQRAQSNSTLQSANENDLPSETTKRSPSTLASLRLSLCAPYSMSFRQPATSP